MKPKLTLALVALITSTAFGSMPKVLPEFKNEKQLAEWRDEMAAKHATTTTATEDHAFYTGKPYITSTGSYAFKYRSYNPELARWTSEDPSGYPDGANNNIYISNMLLNSFDPDGLRRREVDERSIIPTGGNWQNAGYDYSLTNQFLRYSYEIRYTYNDWHETTIGQTTGWGAALEGSSTVGFSQTTQATISATGWSVTLGQSYSESGSQATTITFNRPATQDVAWEGYVLASYADIHYRLRAEHKDSEGNWLPFGMNNGAWSNPELLQSGYTSTYGKVIYKVYE